MTDEDERYSQTVIDRLSPVEPSARLKQLVADIPHSHPRAQVIAFPFKSSWVPAVSLAAAAILGLFVGQNWTETSLPSTATLATVSPSTKVEADEPSYDDLDTDQSSAEAEFAEVDEIEDPDLEALLVFATTGDFESSDWSLAELGSTDADPSNDIPEETH